MRSHGWHTISAPTSSCCFWKLNGWILRNSRLHCGLRPLRWGDTRSCELPVLPSPTQSPRSCFTYGTPPADCHTYILNGQKATLSDTRSVFWFLAREMFPRLLMKFFAILLPIRISARLYI